MKRIAVKPPGKPVTKLFAFVLVFTLVLSALSPAIAGWAAHADGGSVRADGDCAHVCDGDCGYIPSSPCLHIDDEYCGFSAGFGEIPCDMDCDEVHDYDCAFTPGAEGTPCLHGHDDYCGFIEGAPCLHIHDDSCDRSFLSDLLDFFGGLFSSSSNDDDWHFDDTTGTLYGYTGTPFPSSLDIPDTIRGEQVIHIAPNAFFSRSLSSVTLPQYLRTIGVNAFLANQLTTVVIPASVTYIGNYAFRDNSLTEVTLPASLQTLGQGAFMQNPALNSVNFAELTALHTIGNSAFSYCNFDTVTLPPSLTSYGNYVFANNGRYVQVGGGGTGAGAPRTYSVSGQFGEIAGAIRTITVRLRYSDGTTAFPDIVRTTDRAVQAASTADLIADGNTVVITLPDIPGHAPVGGKTLSIPIYEGMVNPIIVTYIPVNENPVFVGLEYIRVNVGAVVNLLAGVRAYDSDGNDITSRIIVTPATISTAAPQVFSVRYTVSDYPQGRSTTVYREVNVGFEPMDVEIGGGWQYKDFLYSNDGTTILGLSATGITKFNGGNVNLVLPGVCPPRTGLNTGFVNITGIGPAPNAANIPQASGSSGIISPAERADIFNYTHFNHLPASTEGGALPVPGMTTVFNQNFSSISFERMMHLERINPYAFPNATALTALDLSMCTQLQVISINAFTNSPLTSLNLSGLHNLRVIGQSAFKGHKLTSIDLSGLARLRVIDAYAFEGALPGGSIRSTINLSGASSLYIIWNYAFRNMAMMSVDFTGCVSLETIGLNAFIFHEMTELDLSPLVSLQEIRNQAFQGMGSLTAIPRLRSLNLSGLSKLRTIGNGVFQLAGLYELDLSGLTSLEMIGVRAFEFSYFAELDFSGLSNLHTIGNDAFYSSPLTSLKFTGCTALRYIGTIDAHPSPWVGDSVRGVFAGARVTELDFTTLTSLVMIGTRAFQYSRPTSLDLSKSTNLTIIGRDAFLNAPLTSLNLTGLSKLGALDVDAFYNARLTELDLSGMTALQAIGNSAFFHSPLTSLTFTGCTALRTIGTSAFRLARTDSVDLSGTALTSLGVNAFQSVPNHSVFYLPNVFPVAGFVTSVSGSPAVTTTPFGTGTAVDVDTRMIWTFIASPLYAHPANYSYNQTYVTEIHIYVNQRGFLLDLFHADGKPMVAPQNVFLTTAAAGVTVRVTAPPIKGYTAQPAYRDLPLNADPRQNRAVFTYVRDTAWSANPNYTVSVTGGQRQRVQNQEWSIDVNVTAGTIPIPAGHTVIIPVTCPYIDLNSLRYQGTAGAGGPVQAFATDRANREIRLTLNAVPAGTAAAGIPIMFRFYSDGRTPHMNVAHFDAFLYNGSTPTATQVTRSNPTVRARAEAYIDKVGLTASVASYNFAVSDTVQLGWGISWGASGYARNIERMAVVYKIPEYYIHPYGGTNEKALAWFDPIDNPGWAPFTRNGAGQVTSIISWPTISDPQSQSANTNNNAHLMANLRFQFSGAPRPQTIAVEAYCVAVPIGANAVELASVAASWYKLSGVSGAPPFNNPTSGETAPVEAPPENWNNAYATNRDNYYATDLYYYRATAYINIEGVIAPPPGDTIRIFKSAAPRTTNINNTAVGDGHARFYDNINNTNRTFHWYLTIHVGRAVTAIDPVIRDFGLDPRMYYYGVRDLRSVTPHTGDIEIAAFGEGGTELGRVIVTGNEYTFPESIRYAIRSIEVKFIGTVPSDARRNFTLLTKRHTNLNGIDYEKQTYAQASADTLHNDKERYYNRAEGWFVAGIDLAGNTIPATLLREENQPWSTTYWLLSHNPSSLRAQKTSNVGRTLLFGDPITYTVGVSGVMSHDEVWTNFQMLDILPRYMELTRVRLTESFSRMPGAKYEVIENYNGSGLTAVLFSADTFVPGTLSSTGTFAVHALAYIDAVAGMRFGADRTLSFENNLYAKVTSGSGTAVVFHDSVTSAVIQGTNVAFAPPFAGPASRAYVQNAYAGGTWRGLRKTVRNIDGANTAWSNDGIITEPGAEFQYRITMTNNTDLSIPSAVIYDIFPFVGDRSLDGEDNLRGSAFRNTFVSVGPMPSGWTVHYTTSSPPANTRTFYANAVWTPTPPSDLSTVTGVRFTSTAEISANTYVDFIINMKAPLPNEAYLYKKAFNSAAYQVGLDTLESNTVYNEVQMRGTITLRKVSGTEGSPPLEGAVFVLRDPANNNQIVQTQRSGADGMVTFTNVLAGNYNIQETYAPSGYQQNTTLIPVNLAQIVAAVDTTTQNTYNLSLGNIVNQPLPPPPPPVITGSMRLEKRNAAGHPMPQVRFRVRGLDDDDPSNSHIDVIGLTNSSGVVVFDGLPLGRYSVEEIWTSNLGFLEAKYQREFTVVDEGIVDLNTVVNDTAAVTLVKIGIYSEELKTRPNHELTTLMGAPVAGVRFELWDGGTNVTAQHTAGGADHILTGPTGRLTFTGLLLNKTYTLREVMTTAQAGLYAGRGTPAGTNAYDYTFSVNADGVLLLDGVVYSRSELVIGNNAKDPDYTMSLRKVNQDGQPMPDVEFEIWSNDAGWDPTPKTVTVKTGPDGMIFLKKADLAEKFSVATTALPYRFFIKEKAAPQGYSTLPDVWEMDLNPDSNISGFNYFNAVNSRIRLELTKYTLISNTVYGALHYLNLTDLLPRYNPDSTLSQVSSDDRIAVQAAAAAAGVRLSETANQWELRIPLAGAEFIVGKNTCAHYSAPCTHGAYSAECAKCANACSYDDCFAAVTGANGRLPVPPGFHFDENAVYRVYESTVPIGYTAFNREFSFRVADYRLINPGFDGTVRFDVNNYPLRGSVTVTKLDIHSGAVLSGVKFELRNTSGYVIATAVTDSTGVALFPNIVFGTYTLVETEPLAGYDKNDEPIEVILPTETGQNHQFVTVYNERTDKVSELVITKTDDSGTLLPGIRFFLEVWNEGLNAGAGDWVRFVNDVNPASPDRYTNSVGVVRFPQLPAGKYRIVEATNSPQYRAPKFSEPVYREKTPFTSDPELVAVPPDPLGPGEFLVLNDEAKIIEVTVVNPLANITLPDIGGPGRRPLMAVGLALLGLGAWLMKMRRRAKA